ncbi:MAG TPA: hypothetical protein VJ385_12040 [Fibrobacteria bacterium]|nr:hypothetical protein [Fibrobacteria bacterium]
MRFPLPKRPFVFAALSLWSALQWGCVLGGTGTDTENGIKDAENPDVVSITGVSARVVDGNGAPLKGVALHLYLPGFRPDSGLAPASLLADTAKALVSDSAGYVTIRLSAAGKFVVEGVSAGQTVFFDTLAVPSVTSSTLFTFRTRSVRGFKGKVKLASGMRIDSGSVFIRGTARHAKVDPAGGYDLGSLPEDVDRMAVGIRFVSSPTSVRQVTEVHNLPGVQDTSKFIYACKDVPKDSAEKIAVPAFLAGGGADTLKPLGASLDTSKVNSALKSCDSLPKGSVINVVSPAAGTSKNMPAGAGVPLLVVKDAVPVTSISGTHLNAAVVLPYAECVPEAGRETTSFDLQVRPEGAVSDLLIKDVADKCLVK